MKLLVFVSSFVVLMGFVTSTNTTWGSVGAYDVLLHHEVVKKSSSLFQVVTLDVVYPESYYYNNKTITAIRVTDQILNDKGGYAQISAGGPGFNFVKLHLKSQRGKSFNFIIEIFGLK